MAKEKFRTRFSERKRVVFDVGDLPSCTNQQWKNESDINYIIKNYTADALNCSLQLANAKLVFGEMVEAGQQFNIFCEHTKQREEFMRLAPEIRKEYNYDFKTFLKESTTKEGLEKLYKLGLLNFNPSDSSTKSDLNSDFSKEQEQNSSSVE